MHKRNSYGFRFSILDLSFIIIILLSTFFCYEFYGSSALFMPYIAGHFFLFCNVFRIPRVPELVWSVIFVAVFTFGFSQSFETELIMIVQLPFTSVIIARELFQPYYHGIFARTINRNLDEYLKNCTT